MMVRMARCVTATVLLLGAARTILAQAPVPTSGADVLRAMHDRYAQSWYSSVSFTQTTRRRGAADSLVNETWYEAAQIPGTLRIDIGAQDGQHVILFAGDSTFAKFQGYPVHRTAGRNPLMILGFDVYKQPVERTVAVLRAEGFDLAKLRVDTLDGKPAYVIGATKGDSVAKQFWIERDRLLLVRILEPTPKGNTASDVRFTDYRPLAGGWIAMHVVATEAGVLMQDEAYHDVKANVALPASLFDPTLLK